MPDVSSAYRSIMTSYVIPAHDIVGLPVAGTSDLFPVRRVYCVGRNYAGHAREMGSTRTASRHSSSANRATRKPWCRPRRTRAGAAISAADQ
jgi:2-keto-4-pentenoate hydratase/2-oxohepta-3-ene-1,7-dioic acid hydratase in catechol pathway